MANKFFSSYSNGKNKDAVDKQLFIEIGNNHLACFSRNHNKEAISDFELFKFDKEESADLNTLFSNITSNSAILGKANTDVKVFFNNDTSLLVPVKGFAKESADDYLKLVYGEKTRTNVLVDELADGGINNVYWINDDWLKILKRNWNSMQIKHLYTNIIGQLSEKGSGKEVLKVVFYDDFIIVALSADSKLHFIQTFTYQSEHDVLYYLLSVGQKFNLHSDNIHLLLSGVLDIRSSLFNELKKYFKRLSVEEVDGNVVQINSSHFPQHYFTPYFNLQR